ncbi:MAG: methylmalonyl Co-A mutase-associated GTPase MeaB, partial [Urechidicola sp.]|nr:methylmalonyl Co-A mutase-associated GTPase MeaB [Urechidicola sp.]
MNTHKHYNLNSLKNASAKEFVHQIINGDISYLSKAITLIESNNEKHYKKATEILEGCLSQPNKSIRIGITGVPGVGKSTFIEAFGNELTEKGKKVAVLAIDPTSSINEGSILGDKTRMELLASNKDAFIRPSPSGKSLGGVARKTRETINLCEAAGFDYILVETVGVGQSEIAVHAMVDFFLLLKLANAGDELQGVKRGIIEMADLIVINKSDGNYKEQANLAKIEFERALHLFPAKSSGWIPKVLTCSSIENRGIHSIISVIEKYLSLTKKNDYFYKRRNEQNVQWFYDTINNELKSHFLKNEKIKREITKYINRIESNKISP